MRSSTEGLCHENSLLEDTDTLLIEFKEAPVTETRDLTRTPCSSLTPKATFVPSRLSRHPNAPAFRSSHTNRLQLSTARVRLPLAAQVVKQPSPLLDGDGLS
jgi:hypothetical protein